MTKKPSHGNLRDGPGNRCIIHYFVKSVLCITNELATHSLQMGLIHSTWSIYPVMCLLAKSYVYLPKIKDYLTVPKVLFQLKYFNASNSITCLENRQLGKTMFIKYKCCFYWKEANSQIIMLYIF